MVRPDDDDVSEPPVDIDRLIEKAVSLPFESAGGDAGTSESGDRATQLERARAERELDAFARRLEQAALHARPLPGRAHALIPCPRCGRLQRIRLTDPPAPTPCPDCGAPIDPGKPFEVSLDQLEAVLAGTGATVLLVLAARSSPLWALSNAMQHALAAGHGMFVVARLDLERYPEAPRKLGLERGPALVIEQGGRRLGAFVFPTFTGVGADMLARWFGPWITGAPAKGLGGAAPLFPAPGEGGGRKATEPET